MGWPWPIGWLGFGPVGVLAPLVASCATGASGWRWCGVVCVAEDAQEDLVVGWGYAGGWCALKGWWDAPKPCGRAGVGVGAVDDVRGREGEVVKVATDTLDAVPFANHVLVASVETVGNLVPRGVRVGEGVHDEHRVGRAVEMEACEDVGFA